MDLGAGGSKTTGNGSETWNAGFNLSGELFGKISRNMLAGGRIAYNRFGRKGEERRLYGGRYPGLTIGVSGAETIVGLLPNIRFIFYSDDVKDAQFFGQLGGGLYFLEYKLVDEGFEAEGNSEHKYGLNFGAGIMMGVSKTMKFLICPMYNIIFSEITAGEKATKFIEINFAIIFNT